MKQLTLFLLLTFSSFLCFGQTNIDPKIEKTTHIFATKDTSVLKLDKYRLKNVSEKQPCLFFVFGGGFKNGIRDDKSLNHYFNYFAKQGITVIAIDYRLGMKGQKGIGINKYKPLKRAIDMAVEDLFDATRFTIDHAGEWHIDTSRFILSGSSAGAVTVLQAEYENRNKLSSAQKLPTEFQYAGVISFAGAIFRTDGGLKWKKTACPIMLFHGEEDKVVPYNKIRFFKIGFFGSKTIADKLKKHEFSYVFLSYKNAAHEVSSFSMRERKAEMMLFINDCILGNRKVQIDLKINEMDKKKGTKKESYKDLYK